MPVGAARVGVPLGFSSTAVAAVGDHVPQPPSLQAFTRARDTIATFKASHLTRRLKLYAFRKRLITHCLHLSELALEILELSCEDDELGEWG